MNNASRGIVALLFLATALFAGSQTMPANIPPPAHPITRAQVQQLVELSHTREITRNALHTAFNSQQNPNGIIPKEFFDDMAAEMDKVDFVALMLPVYQKYVSEEDASAALAFYATPAGRRFMDANPFIVAETQKAGMQQGREIANRVILKYKDQIEANARAAAAKQAAEQKQEQK